LALFRNFIDRHFAPSRTGPGRVQKKPLKLHALKDRDAIPVALGQVLNAISASTLTEKSAGQLLFGLRIASDNLRNAARPKAES